MNVTVSFDGINHDVQRGVSGNMLNIFKLIGMLGNRIKFSYTLSRYNVDHFAMDMWFLSKFTGNKIYTCLEQQLPIFDSKDEFKAIEVPPLDDELIDRMFDEKSRRYLYNFYRYANKCTSPLDVHTIMENGDVILCQSFLSSVVIGNIYNEQLSDILHRSKSLIEDLCKQCPHKSRCKLVCQRRYDMFEEGEQI
jgi:radical SAM protein with 4Fe4S-binding SPASM domain